MSNIARTGVLSPIRSGFCRQISQANGCRYFTVLHKSRQFPKVRKSQNPFQPIIQINAETIESQPKSVNSSENPDPEGEADEIEMEEFKSTIEKLLQKEYLTGADLRHLDMEDFSRIPVKERKALLRKVGRLPASSSADDTNDASSSSDDTNESSQSSSKDDSVPAPAKRKDRKSIHSKDLYSKAISSKSASTSEISADLQSLTKRVARGGQWSRRQAERIIREGRVTVDGAQVEVVAEHVSVDARVCVDGKELIEEKTPRVWCYYKPTGELVTRTDPDGRKTVYDSLPKVCKDYDKLPRLINVGRLDCNSEGLLLFTNMGIVANFLENPESGLKRNYKAHVKGKIDENAIKCLAKGVTIDSIRYKPMKVNVVSKANGKSKFSILELELTEGKKREVRIALSYIGLTVSRLIRTSFGPFTLWPLTPRKIIEFPIPSKLRKELDAYNAKIEDGDDELKSNK
eukprot:27599_1